MESRPSERDMMEVPERPDLRCVDHESVYEVVHRLYHHLLELEERVRRLEE